MILLCLADEDSDASAPSPHHLCLSMKDNCIFNIEISLQCYYTFVYEQNKSRSL